MGVSQSTTEAMSMEKLFANLKDCSQDIKLEFQVECSPVETPEEELLRLQNRFSDLLADISRRDFGLVDARNRLNKRLKQIHGDLHLIVSDVASRANYARELVQVLTECFKEHLSSLSVESLEDVRTVVETMARMNGILAVCVKMCETVIRYGEEDAEDLLKWLVRDPTPQNFVDRMLARAYEYYAQSPCSAIIIGVVSALLVGGIIGNIIISMGGTSIIAKALGLTTSLIAGSELFAGVAIQGRRVAMCSLDKHLEQLRHSSKRLLRGLEKNPSELNVFRGTLINVCVVYDQVDATLRMGTIAQQQGVSCPICWLPFAEGSRVVVSAVNDTCARHHVFCAECFVGHAKIYTKHKAVPPCPICRRPVSNTRTLILYSQQEGRPSKRLCIGGT